MNKQMNIIKRPMAWLITAVIYIWLFSIGIFIASIGPPLIISQIAADKDNRISMTGIEKSFVIYAQEGAKSLNVKYKYLIYLLLLNIIFLLPSLVIGAFTLRKQLWARNGLIGLLTLYLVLPIVFAVATSEYNLDIFNINRLPFIAIIFLLTREKIKSIFTEHINQGDGV